MSAQIGLTASGCSSLCLVVFGFGLALVLVWVWCGLVLFDLVWLGLGFGLVWFGLDWHSFRLVMIWCLSWFLFDFGLAWSCYFALFGYDVLCSGVACCGLCVLLCLGGC